MSTSIVLAAHTPECLNAVHIKSVPSIFLRRSQFKVFECVVLSIQVFMVYLYSIWNLAMKRLPYRSMRRTAVIVGIFGKEEVEVEVCTENWFERTIRAITYPCFTVSNRTHGGTASSYRGSNVEKFFSALKSASNVRNMLWHKSSSSLHTTRLAKLVYRIITLKTQYWFPHLYMLHQVKGD